MMRAYVLHGPGRGGVEDVECPSAGPGQVIVTVERVGICGTDVEFFTGRQAYLHDGGAAFPMRLGHEWCGIVTSVGEGVETAWLGRRVTGDTMLGCGSCRRCRSGRHHLCADRYEIGIRGGWPGALAERMTVPARFLHPLPDGVDVVAGALVEPGGNALRAVHAAALRPGAAVLICGPGTIGQLACRFARAQGADAHLLAPDEKAAQASRELGLEQVWTLDELPDLEYSAVIDATNAPEIPARAIELVEPGGRVVYIGLAERPSTIDTRRLVLNDLTTIGVLGASAGLQGAIDEYASGRVDPRPLVAAAVGLEDVGRVLEGWRPPDAGPGPKIHVDPRR